MFRTQIYLTAEEKKGLKSIARQRGISQSDLIRQAIDDFLAKNSNADKAEVIDKIAGIWADRNDVPNIRELRSGWSKRSVR